MEFEEKVVVVAGASGNLGDAVARAFQRKGAGLALIDRSQDHLLQKFPDLAESDSHLLINCADMTSPEIVGQTVERIWETFGRIDVFVSVVGGFRSGTPLHETPLSTFDFMMAINARTFYIASQAIIPRMLEGGGGRIIGVGARPGLKGVKNMSAYSAAKSVVIRMVESMASELSDRNINVNCILPGTINTPQNREALPKADHGRWVTTESLAGVIVFLASDAARDISGACLPVYGKS